MNDSKRKIHYLLIFVAIFIVISSLEVLMRAKDVDLYLAWKNSLPPADIALEYNLYISLLLLRYIKELFIPIFFTIYYLFVFKKHPSSKLSFFVWGALLLSAFIIELVKLEFFSLFYYIKIVCYLGMMASNYSLYLNRENR